MKMSRLLEDYFVNDTRSRLHEAGFMQGLPIVPKKSEWKAEGDKLLRKFEFKDGSHLKDFVIVLLELSEDSHNKITITIESSTVKVSNPIGAYSSDDFLQDLDDAYTEITGV